MAVYILAIVYATTLMLQLTALVAVLGVLGILTWIGYTMFTAPPPPKVGSLSELDSLQAETINPQEDCRARQLSFSQIVDAEIGEGTVVYKVGDGVEYWIPTTVTLGSFVKIIDVQAKVVGSATLAYQGKNLNCWKLHYAWTDGSGAILSETTWYYEKTTGLWIAASWILYDGSGNPVNNWGGHLASTNVPLPSCACT